MAMKHLSDLLGGSLERAHIFHGVIASQAVEQANIWLEEVLPSTRRDDACAMLLKDGYLVIACTNTSAATFVKEREEECRTFVLRAVPRADLRALTTRLVHEMKAHEF